MERSNQNDGIVYINLSMSNPIDNKVKAPVVFDAINNTVILENADDYVLQIVKFSIPTDLVAKVVVKIKDPMTLETNYGLSMKVGAFVDTENLVFVPDDLTSYESKSDYYNYYDIQEFIDITNTALLNAYSVCFANDGTLPGTQYAPFIYYNTLTGRYNLYVYDACLTHAPPLEISFNGQLQNIFKFPNVITGANQYQQIVKNRLVNVVTDPNSLVNGYVYIESSYKSNTSPSLEKILFACDYGMSITQEYIKGTSVNNNQTVAKAILTDFDVDHNEDNSQYVQFQSSGFQNARTIQVNSSEPIKNFSISASSVNTDGESQPILIMPGSTASIKLAWVPRMFISNYNRLR